MKKGLFRNSPRYRKFVRDRDQALEQFLNNTQIKNSNVLRGTFRHILTQAKLNYTQLTGPNYNQALQTLSAEVNSSMAHAKAELLNNLLTLRRITYYLSRSSEIEAISQATNKSLRNEIPHFDQHARVNKHSAAGGSLSDRIALYLNRISSKIINNAHAASISRTKDSDGVETPLSQEDFLLRIYYAFPKTKRVKRLKRELKSYLYEADTKAKVDISQDFLDDRSWREVVDEYLKEIPSTRGPEEIAGKRLTPEGEEETYYQWELERDTTQEFVQSVREGQMDGAEANGVKDFVWIAIIDDVTDECCRWRDGLTLTEIEEKLKGERSDDSCQATTPPAHFNCATAGHEITTIQGKKNVEDIRPGDVVLTHTGEYKKVSRSLQSIAKKTLVFTLSNGTKLRVTEDHPFFVHEKVLTAKSLKPGDCLTLSDSAHENDISRKESEGI